ncbi:MBL fold metallo-hydrolase [Pararcticibacter amylolyticus]|uniref:MBL fold hydrolase n=1 Tax=Pararcticibacter amylolyticus TaxID=2173175 RepID=A0A2U2PFD9_9SPHI|nr:MBL fold metallo-hydrolase [Pararcticibacter amylolyticus]PWG80044.1 MBL fold hydrolase [Pararcticibacter amylolyticus]
MKVFPLYEGSYSVDKSKKFLPFDPAIHDPKDRPASLFVFVQPFLVETSSELLVLDTGLGFKDEQGMLIIHENIRKAGYDPADVSKVLMSHLHFDHSAGMIWENDGTMQLSFPNAEYVINRNEWETAYSSQSASYHIDIFDVVQRSGSIHFIEGNGQLDEHISYEVTGGHCQYHQVFLIKEGEEKIFFGGDVLPEPEQLLRRFKAKYDFDGARSMELREEFGNLAAKENWLCLFYHAKSEAMARVEVVDGAFRIVK